MTGQEFRKRRKALGLTQEQLGERWGIPQETISVWENERVTIRHGKVIDDALKYLEGKKTDAKTNL